MIGINWGSSNVRAYYIDDEGNIVDSYSSDQGISKITHDEIAGVFGGIVSQWPCTDDIYLSGMVGSPIGWQEVDYRQCPTEVESLTSKFGLVSAHGKNAKIISGLSCTTSWGDPEVMRGEEVELFGLLSLRPELNVGEKFIALPGTHTKWVRVIDGDVVEFFTSMSAELFDHLKANGLLKTIISSPAAVNDSFYRGVDRGIDNKGGLGRLLFGVRAQVMTGTHSIEGASSYARGLLIGAEIADALSLYPALKNINSIPLLGNSGLCEMYSAALSRFDLSAHVENGAEAVCAGYMAIHNQVRNG